MMDGGIIADRTLIERNMFWNDGTWRRLGGSAVPGPATRWARDALVGMRNMDLSIAWVRLRFVEHVAFFSGALVQYRWIEWDSFNDLYFF